ncbi:MAG TPA: hypothetical protein VMU88_07105 [bacterium]|nr:hypothetical protein [bacterium]
MAKTPAPSFLEKRYPFVFFSFFYFLFTALTYKDFGETWDESGVYTRGMVLGRYLWDGEWMGLLHKAAPDDGMVLYDHWYAWVLSLLNPSAGIDYYHWLNLGFGFLLFAAAYELALAELQKPWAALLAPLFLFLTPRLTGDLPANPKDGPFATLYLLSLAAVFLAGRKPFPGPVKILVLGLFFGLTISQRLVGFTLFLVWPLHEWLQGRRAAPGKKTNPPRPAFWGETLPTLLLVFLGANFILVATWPYLGADYFHRLLELLTAAQNYPWSNPVLFMGREIPAPDLPRTYLPVFLLVTTPLFLLGWAAASFGALKNGRARPLGSLLTLALGVNLGLYLLLKPVVYDGLRHFLFLLPLIGILAALAFGEFLASRRRPTGLGWALVALTGLGAGLTALDMARLHPYEYVYFNELAGGLKGAQKNFETDYWGASYKEAVEWVAGLTPGNANQPVTLTASGNSYQLAPYCPNNFHWTDDRAQADYYLTTTRDGKDKLEDPSKIVHVVEREGVPLCYVFKLR